MTKQTNEKILSKRLLDRVVVSKGGKKFGEIGDFVFDTKTGEIIDFTIINPTKHVEILKLEKDTNGDFLMPFHSVLAIGDFVLISEEDII